MNNDDALIEYRVAKAMKAEERRAARQKKINDSYYDSSYPEIDGATMRELRENDKNWK